MNLCPPAVLFSRYRVIRLSDRQNDGRPLEMATTRIPKSAFDKRHACSSAYGEKAQTVPNTLPVCHRPVSYPDFFGLIRLFHLFHYLAEKQIRIAFSLSFLNRSIYPSDLSF